MHVRQCIDMHVLTRTRLECFARLARFPLSFLMIHSLLHPSQRTNFNSLSDRVSSTPTVTDSEMASNMIASAIDVKVPQLASASGSGAGVPHALWRPQMQTFLMRQGIEERDYAREITQWRQLSTVVQMDAESEEQDAIDIILGGASASSASAQPPMKKEVPTPEQVKAKKHVADLISRSRKAYGYLYGALPVDLRPLVADVPQGYAYGIWSFLEKKFRNTEQDSIMALWERITTVSQEAEETYDVYKARVDSIIELLAHAKQALPPGLYASLLLWRLQPRYATAVLTLKTSDRLKDPAVIEWSSIAEYMAQYERSQLGLSGDADSTLGRSSGSDRAMMVTRAGSKPTYGIAAKDRQLQSVSLDQIDCFNCHEYGHYRSDCKLPDRRLTQKGYDIRKQHRPRNKHASSAYVASAAQASDSDSDGGDNVERKRRTLARSKPKIAPGMHKANTVRQVNRFDSLAPQEDEADAAITHHDDVASPLALSYCARVLAGLTQDARANIPSGEPHGARKMKQVTLVPLGPKTKAQSRESDRRKPAISMTCSPSPAAAKSMDEQLRTSAKAVDSGATVSVTGNKDNLINVRHCAPVPIMMADGSIVNAVYKGDMPMRLPVANKPGTHVDITIGDVYFHDRIDANLLSWGCMRVDGWEMHSTSEGTHLVTPNGARINASTRGRLTVLNDAGPERACAARMGRFVSQNADDLMRLHQRTGHVSWSRLIKMCRAGLTAGVGDISGMTTEELKMAKERVRSCDACIAGKQHRNPLGHRGLDKGTAPGEVLHMDVFYSVLRDPRTNMKYREYALLTTDGFTEFRWIYQTKSMQALQDAVISIIRLSTTTTGRRPRLIISDLGSEFDNKKVKTYCATRGIQLQPSPPRAKELNGVAEKSVDTVKNHTRAMLLAAKLPEQMGWARAAAHHVFLWNRTHIGANTGKTPYEAMLKRQPSIISIGVMGCDAFVHQDRTQRDTTFSPKALPGIYLGHDVHQNCSVVYMLHSGKMIRAKDVLFREGSFKHLRADLQGQQDQIGPLDLTQLGHRDDVDDVVDQGRRGDESDAACDDTPTMSGSDSKEDVKARTTSCAMESDDDDDNDHDSTSSSSTSSKQRFEVKAITDQRMNSSGNVEYRVKWVGYSASTWEPALSMREDAPDAVRQYEAFVAVRSEARVTRSRSAAAAASPVIPPVLSSSSRDSESDLDDESEASAIEAARFVAAKCL